MYNNVARPVEFLSLSIAYSSQKYIVCYFIVQKQDSQLYKTDTVFNFNIFAIVNYLTFDDDWIVQFLNWKQKIYSSHFSLALLWFVTKVISYFNIYIT